MAFRPVNALRRVVVDLVGDPLGDARQSRLDDQTTRTARGLGSHALVGEKGDPSSTFGGAVPYDAQHFRGAAMLGSPNIYVPASPTLDTAADSQNDPVMTILADRMRRTRP